MSDLNLRVINGEEQRVVSWQDDQYLSFEEATDVEFDKAYRLRVERENLIKAVEDAKAALAAHESSSCSHLICYDEVSHIYYARHCVCCNIIVALI